MQKEEVRSSTVRSQEVRFHRSDTHSRALEQLIGTINLAVSTATLESIPAVTLIQRQQCLSKFYIGE